MYSDFESRISNQLSKLNIMKPKPYKEEKYFIKKFLYIWNLNHLCNLLINIYCFEDYNDLWFLKDSLDKNSIDYDKTLDKHLDNYPLSKDKLLWLLEAICTNNKPEPILY
jgi:hypothetical protein